MHENSPGGLCKSWHIVDLLGALPCASERMCVYESVSSYSYFWLWCCVHQNFYDLYQLAHSSNQHTKMENRRLNYANYVDFFWWVCDCISWTEIEMFQTYGFVRSFVCFSCAEIKQSHWRYRARKKTTTNAPNNLWKRWFSCHFAVNADFCKVQRHTESQNRDEPKTAPNWRVTARIHGKENQSQQNPTKK